MTRFFDFTFSIIGLVILLPFLLIISVFIFLEDFGNIFYLQTRIGKNSKSFQLFKFRTMKADSDKKGLLTIGGKDSRITKVGYLLRKFKIDELPQLINVCIGDMSLVGPRPEVEKYVKLYNSDQLKVLNVKPGITDIASIEYFDENILLGKAENPEKLYIEKIMPDKIQLNLKYINNPNLKFYFKILFLTFLKIIKR